MNEKVLILNEFNNETDPYEYIFDLGGKVYIGAESISDNDYSISLEDIFHAPPFVDTIKNQIIILCQEMQGGKCIAVACMKNATVYKNSVEYNWLYANYNIVCNAEDCFFIQPADRELVFTTETFLWDNSPKTNSYLNKICIPKNCVKIDTCQLDKKVAAAKTYNELVEVSIEYDNAHQYLKSLEIWKREYEKDRRNKDIMFQLGISLMDCADYKNARIYLERCFEEKKSDDAYLSRLAILYFRAYYNAEAKSIADMISDRSYLDDWGYAYDRIVSYAPVHINADSVMGNDFVKHRIDLGFTDMPLPEIIKDYDGTKRYLDPVRNKAIPLTPEETVRQKVLRYLLDILAIPRDYIISEDHMSHYDKNSTTRADITVRHNDETYLIVECKAPDIVIDGDPIRQLFGYNDILKSKYLLLTNGTDSYIFQRNCAGKYDSITQLPAYGDMINGTMAEINPIKRNKLKRPSITEMKNPETINQYKNDGFYVGVNTPDYLVPFIINLMWAFMDSEHRIQECTGCGITIEKDNGTVDMKLTNVSGGSFPGRYRQFLVCDRFGNHLFVSFAVLGTWSNATKGGYTSLVCGVDRGSQHISRLQLRLDSNCDIGIFSTTLSHDGTRSRRKRQDTIDYVKSVCSALVKQNRIHLGVFPNNKLISMEDSNVKDFIVRLTAYVLLRDEMSRLGL